MAHRPPSYDTGGPWHGTYSLDRFFEYVPALARSPTSAGAHQFRYLNAAMDGVPSGDMPYLSRNFT
jgi:hypothetical protein